MPILPVWIDSWQLGCCGEDHVAEVGQRWRETLLILVDAFRPTEERALGWRAFNEDRIAFTARVLNSPDPIRVTQPILDLGACRVGRGSKDIRAGGVIAGEGVVYADWHVGFDDDDRRHQVIVEGTVRRVRAYKRSLERDPGSASGIRSISRLEPVDVQRTGRWVGAETGDALIDLEVGGGPVVGSQPAAPS
jgi:uncharacterized protein DUF6578